MKLYTSRFRIYANGTKTSCENDALIIKLNGQPETNLGEKLTYFYMTEANLHITTTGIRAIFETVANEKLSTNEITEAQATAISRVIGVSVYKYFSHIFGRCF